VPIADAANRPRIVRKLHARAPVRKRLTVASTVRSSTHKRTAPGEVSIGRSSRSVTMSHSRLRGELISARIGANDGAQTRSTQDRTAGL